MKKSEQKLKFDKKIIVKVTRPLFSFSPYIKGAVCALSKSQGIVKGNPTDLVVEMANVKPNPKKVDLYKKVCGYSEEYFGLPLTFPETLFIYPLSVLATSKFFPLSPLGLIHIGQSISQYKPLTEEMSLNVSCRTSEIWQVDRGILLKISLQAMVNGECVWEGVTELISRAKYTIKKRKCREKNSIDKETQPVAFFRVLDNTGRQYAKASGDYNPHHLYPATAKFLGYRRAIAHGMWSLARCIAEIEKNKPMEFPCSIHTFFKLPIFMPADVALYYEIETDHTAHFSLRDVKQGLPHVTGQIDNI